MSIVPKLMLMAVALFGLIAEWQARQFPQNAIPLAVLSFGSYVAWAMTIVATLLIARDAKAARNQRNSN